MPPKPQQPLLYLTAYSDKETFCFPGHAASRPSGSTNLLTRLAASWLCRCRQREAAIRRLLALDDRMLTDIGLSSAERDRIIRSWRARQWQPKQRTEAADKETGR